MSSIKELAAHFCFRKKEFFYALQRTMEANAKGELLQNRLAQFQTIIVSVMMVWLSAIMQIQNMVII